MALSGSELEVTCGCLGVSWRCGVGRLLKQLSAGKGMDG